MADSGGPIIQTSNLDQIFNALKNQDPSKSRELSSPRTPDYKTIPNHNYAPGTTVHGAFGGGMQRYAGASANGGMIYGQPQFFSPVHTPINWQIPSKRIEQYQWARFFYCLTPDNKVLMSDGTEKKICEIKPDDKIIDENGNIQRVLRVHTRNIEEDILEITLGGNNNIKTSITKSHELKVVQEETWKKSSNTVWSERRKEERIRDFGKTELDEVWKESGDAKVGDWMISPELKSGVGFMPEILSDNMCWLLGLFAADGSYYWYTYKKERKHPKGIRITLSNDEKNTIGEKVKKLIHDELGMSIKEYKNGIGNCYDAVLHNVPIAKLFYSIIGNGCVSKNICKEFIHNASHSQLLNFISGFSDGDGCLSNSMGNQIRTSSPHLALQLGIICTKLNLTHSHNWQNNKETTFRIQEGEEYTSPTVPTCCVRISRESCDVLKNMCIKYDKLTKAHHHKIREYLTINNKTYRKIIKIEQKKYQGTVYDLEIESNHTYCVNGCIVHNSNEPKVAASIDFYCFEPHTQILMADGSQQCISSIQEGNLIRSHDGSVNSVLRVNKRMAKNEKMLKIKIAGISGEDFSFLKTTPGHELLTDINGDIKFSQAGTLKEGDFLLTPCLYDRIDDFNISNDFAWLIGAYAAEGFGIPYEHESKEGKIEKYYKGVYFTLNFNEYETFAQEIKNKIIAVYGDIDVTIRADPSSGSTIISAYGQNIADDLCGSCPGLSSYGTKRLSPWVMKCSKENLIHIMAGFYSGDGCYNTNNGFQGVGVSRKLADQIANICDIVGVEYSYTKTRAPGNRQTIYNIRISRRACNVFEKLSYKVKDNRNIDEDYSRNTPYFVKEKYIYRKIYSIGEYTYDGELYDLSIDGKHSYVANRIAVHNSSFPMNGFENECKDRDVKKHFDKLVKRIDLSKWLRLISHETHLLGDCFPFVEISCEHCSGTGKNGDELCEHDGGTVRRVVILNPDYVEVYTSPINPEPVIALKPDEELINMVQRKTPGFDRLAPDVRALVSSGRPIRLDNRNVYHLKYGEGGYDRYGIGMVRRLFPILSYKTKLMVAQWVVAERLIIPIKIVKVGSDERPAGPADIAAVQEQLAQTANDPNLTIVTHHAFDIDFMGAAGKVLTLSNEFELINQEILDGMMINNALLNGEGPNFSAAAVGIEAMIERLQTFRREVANWVEQKIYLPEAKRQGFIDENANSEEDEYIYPKIKWNSMHLRDQQQFRTFVLQLYEKGLLSAQTVLEAFDFDPDQEIERKRYDAIQMAAVGGAMGGAGGAGGAPGMPGGDMGGGFGGMGGGGGGGMPPMPGGDGGAPGGMGGGAPISAPPGGAAGAPPMASTKNSITTVSENNNVANPSNYGGRVLKQKTREKMDSEKSKVYKRMQAPQDPSTMTGMRDAKGRIVFTKCERQLLDQLQKYSKDGLIRYPIVPQFEVKFGSVTYPIDFAFPHLKIALEADGEAFHSSPKQVTHDKERDMKLSSLGWTVLRFKDSEIEDQVERVMSAVIKTIMQKEASLEKQKESLPPSVAT